MCNKSHHTLLRADYQFNSPIMARKDEDSEKLQQNNNVSVKLKQTNKT